MSIPKSVFDAFAAAGEEAVTDNKTVEELKDSPAILKRFWSYADQETKAKARPVLWFIYGWAIAMVLIAFAQLYSILALMAIAPVALILYVFTVEPFKVAVGSIADQKILQGRLRNLVISIAIWQIAATIALRFIPLYANPELGVWLVIAVVGWVLSGIAQNDSAKTVGSFLLLVSLALTIVLVVTALSNNADKAGSGSVQEQRQEQRVDSTAIQKKPSQATDNTTSAASSSSVSTTPKSRFYGVKECAGEPESRTIASDDGKRRMKAKPGCWTSPIKMPLNTPFGIDSRGPIDVMYINEEVVHGYGSTTYRINGAIPNFQTFRLRASDVEEDVDIFITD